MLGARLLWNRLSPATLSLAAAALLLAAAASPALAAKGDRKGDAKEKGDPNGPLAAIASLDGDKVRMAKAKVAARVTRIADAAADQVTADGTLAASAPAYSDIEAVYVAPIRVPRKLLTRMADDYPRGAVGAFYGADADWSKLDRALFVSVALAEPRPSGAVQQVEVGLDGDAASPVQAGSAGDTRAGVERFSLSGSFSDGSESSGTTDVSGRRPGDAIDYYNAESGVFGFYDGRPSSYFLVMPLTADTRSVAVTLRTVTDSGEIIDRLELPGGGHLIPLAEPAAGFGAKAGVDPLGCRSLETYSAGSGVMALDDPTATLIRYSAGAGAALPLTEAEALLAALDAYAESVPVTLERLDADGGSVSVDAQLARAPALNAFTLTMEVPAGRWTFEAADGTALLTPAGEALIDPTSLTGRAGVLTGEGLDGFVSGDSTCARWDLGTEACQLVPAAGMAALVGLEEADVEQTPVARADGSRWCVGIIPATGEPQYITRFGTGYLPSGQPEGMGVALACDSYPLDIGAEGITVDCGAEGYENHSFRVVPQATAQADPEGGLLVSIDMLVDRAKPYGERYDGAAATALFEGIAAKVAASAIPAGA